MTFCSLSLGRRPGVRRCRGGDGVESTYAALCGLVAAHHRLLRYCRIRKYKNHNNKIAEIRMIMTVCQRISVCSHPEVCCTYSKESTSSECRGFARREFKSCGV